MKKTLIALAAATSVAVTMTACNAPNNNDRTTTTPRMVSATATANDPTAGYDAPPAPRDLSPPPPNANKIAPGTDPEAAFADRPNDKDPPNDASKDGAAEDQHRWVKAQEAAAEAPDTAAADKAKKEVMEAKDVDHSSPSAGAVGAGSSKSANESTRTTNDKPRQGALTKDEETKQSPKEGQVNNYSSTDLEKDSGRPSDGSAK